MIVYITDFYSIIYSVHFDYSEFKTSLKTYIYIYMNHLNIHTHTIRILFLEK